MVMRFVAAFEGVDDSLLDGLSGPERAKAYAAALNRTARDMRARAAERMAEQIAFPAGYLNPGQGRLTVHKVASPANLQASILGKSPPTSLATFARGGTPGKAGVTVEVVKGQTEFMKRAFIMKLRQGDSPISSGFNRGLAIRLKPGETLQNKKFNVRRVESGLYLLYGPSVNQVFINNAGTGVAKDMEGEVLLNLRVELSRILKRNFE